MMTSSPESGILGIMAKLEPPLERLDAPDLCAQLDRMKALCDRLEDAQTNHAKYRELVDQIQAEVDALRHYMWRADVK
jgi:hypothetical protein